MNATEFQEKVEELLTQLTNLRGQLKMVAKSATDIKGDFVSYTSDGRKWAHWGSAGSALLHTSLTDESLRCFLYGQENVQEFERLTDEK
jgi:hypothetical protein